MESSEHNWANISETICSKCQFFASRPLGCYSFQNILTNAIISQINTLLLPYFISYYSSAFAILFISSTTMMLKCTLHSVLSKQGSHKFFLQTDSHIIITFQHVNRTFNVIFVSSKQMDHCLTDVSINRICAEALLSFRYRLYPSFQAVGDTYL